MACSEMFLILRYLVQRGSTVLKKKIDNIDFDLEYMTAFFNCLNFCECYIMFYECILGVHSVSVCSACDWVTNEA